MFYLWCGYNSKRTTRQNHVRMTSDLRRPSASLSAGLFIRHKLGLEYIQPFSCSFVRVGQRDLGGGLIVSVLLLHQCTFQWQVDNLVKFCISRTPFGSIIHSLLYLPICKTFKIVAMIKWKTCICRRLHDLRFKRISSFFIFIVLALTLLLLVSFSLRNMQLQVLPIFTVALIHNTSGPLTFHKKS